MEGSQLARARRGVGAHAQVSQSATGQLQALALRAMHVLRRRPALLHTLLVAAKPLPASCNAYRLLPRTGLRCTGHTR